MNRAVSTGCSKGATKTCEKPIQKKWKLSPIKSKGKDKRCNTWTLWYLVTFKIRLGMVPLGFVLEAQFEKTVMCADGCVACLSFHTLSLHCFC